MADPGPKPAAVRMSGKSVNLLNSSLQGSRLAEDPDLPRPGDDLTTKRSGGLIADEKDGGFRAASSSWSWAESRSTIGRRSALAGVVSTSLRNPSRTSLGRSQEWSRWT